MEKWISNGAESSFLRQLIKINEILNKEILVDKIAEPQISDNKKDDIITDFEYIKQELILIGLRDISWLEIYGIVDVARILICIDLEMRINKLGYYNLNEDVFEAIERLSVTEKLIIISDYINKTKFKGTKGFEYLKEFKKFRNSYAHGKVGEITYKEINSNDIKVEKKIENTISEDKYKSLVNRGLSSYLKEFLASCDKYIELIDYLNKINQFGKEIYCDREKENIELFTGYIKKQCKILDGEMELDDEIRGHLQMILDKLYINIVTAKERESVSI